MTLTCGSWSESQSRFSDFASVWPDVWPQKNCRSLWPIFHGPVILPYILKTIWCMNILLQDYDQTFDLKNKSRSLWPVFHGPVILPCILKTFDVWTSYFWIMSQYDLKINVGHCDLYFMVQWFCLISWSLWRLFDVWTSYFGIMSQYDPTFDLKNKCRSLQWVPCGWNSSYSFPPIETLQMFLPWNEDVPVVLVLSFDIFFLYLSNFQVLICLSPHIAL